MQIIEWPRFLEEALPLEEKQSAVTVGVFDGVHRGHRALIETIVSHNGGAVPVVVTFTHSLYKESRNKKHPGDILSFRQKTNIFKMLGVSITIVIEFSESFRLMPGAEFLRILQEHAKMDFMAVGSNFRCGYQLDTDTPAIQTLNARRGIKTGIVAPLEEDSKPISSSQIRAAIAGGNLKAAAAMLGRPFTVDLGGASIISGSGAAAYDIAGQGRILPPPGKYPVFILGESGDQRDKTRAEIIVDKGCIKIQSAGGKTTGGAFPGYVEFFS